tara:strand:- start:1231 stop:1386 length:156 start_codon:yes stop_codon:yes gene_type:complete
VEKQEQPKAEPPASVKELIIPKDAKVQTSKKKIIVPPKVTRDIESGDIVIS